MHANRIDRAFDDAIQAAIAMMMAEIEFAQRRQLDVAFVYDSLRFQKIGNRTAHVAKPGERDFAIQLANQIIETYHLARTARIPKAALARCMLVTAFAAIDAFVLVDVDFINGKIGFGLEHDEVAVFRHAIFAEHVLHRPRHAGMGF